ncbi:partial Methyl-accepting chemotaxis protein 4, partial [Anaerolineae bacterium]
MRRFSDWRINYKMGALIVSALLPVILVFFFKVLPDTEEQFLEDKKREIKSVVEAGYNVLEIYYQRVQSGELTMEDAEVKMGNELNAYRYAGKEYYFAYDLQGVTKALGSDAKLVGTNRYDIKDKKDNYFLRDMINMVKTNGEGFVTYYYPKLGETEASPKISFVKMHPGWKILIGSGLYLDDVDANITAFTTNLLITIGIAVLIAAILGYFIMRLIVKPILALNIAAEKAAAGDYSVETKVESKDEIGTLGLAFNKMLKTIASSIEEVTAKQADAERSAIEAKQAQEKAEKQEDYLKSSVEVILGEMQKFSAGDLTVELDEKDKGIIGDLFRGFNRAVQNVRSMLIRVHEAVQATASASTEISSSTEELAAGMQEQSQQVDEVAGAVEEMTKTIIETSRNASGAADASKNAGSTAGVGGNVVKDTIQGMNRIADVVQHSAETVLALGKSSEQIGEIIQVIDDIADQTNLLALNAAIEAARAGEQGRGFAVVADEVRKLAERTTKATKEIADMIKTIQRETSGAVTSMQQGREEVDRGKTLADSAGKSLNEIISATVQVGDLISQVATASEEQSSAAEQISKSIESMRSVTRESATGISQIARASEDLNRLTHQLEELMSEFRISGQET